jgi:hypothetical protein
MSIISRLDAKFGRFAVPNLTVILIIGQVFLYVAHQLNPGRQGFDILNRISFEPDKVVAGEYWRLVSFLFAPPLSNLIFAFFFWYLFYLMGTTLEVTWGTFRYNVYLLIGYVCSVVAAFIVYFSHAPVPATVAPNGFLYGSIFLAFARHFPDFTLYTMMVIPIRIRWLAMIQWVVYGFEFFSGPWMTKAMIFASIANYLLFFGRDIWLDIKHGHRRTRFQARAMQGPQRIVHVCHTCGITSDDAPHMQFRYCSKCNGDACYCPAHLSEHEHVVAPIAGAGEPRNV